jgi:hypothetical protein
MTNETEREQMQSRFDGGNEASKPVSSDEYFANRIADAHFVLENEHREVGIGAGKMLHRFTGSEKSMAQTIVDLNADLTTARQAAERERDELKSMGLVAQQTLDEIDNWLGSASTRQAAMDSIWRLQRVLQQLGFKHDWHNTLDWRGSLLKELNDAGFFSGEGGLFRYDPTADKEKPYRVYGNAVGMTIAEMVAELERSRTAAAQDVGSVDAYAGLLAEGQLANELLEWAADESNVLFYDYDSHYGYDNKKCILCNEYVSERQGLDKPITHKPDCLHLAAKSFQAAVVAGRGEAG